MKPRRKTQISVHVQLIADQHGKHGGVCSAWVVHAHIDTALGSETGNMTRLDSHGAKTRSRGVVCCAVSTGADQARH